jgi:hypothetical protein
MDQLYWNPAVTKYNAIGAITNFAQAFIYDCCINHGASGCQRIIDYTTSNCSGTPGTGVDEETYLREMINIRNTTYNKASRDTAWSNLLNTGNLDLTPEYVFLAWGDTFVIDGNLGFNTGYSNYTATNLITVTQNLKILLKTTDADSEDSLKIIKINSNSITKLNSESNLFELVTSEINSGYLLGTLAVIILAAVMIMKGLI